MGDDAQGRAEMGRGLLRFFGVLLYGLAAVGIATGAYGAAGACTALGFALIVSAKLL